MHVRGIACGVAPVVDVGIVRVRAERLYASCTKPADASLSSCPGHFLQEADGVSTDRGAVRAVHGRPRIVGALLANGVRCRYSLERSRHLRYTPSFLLPTQAHINARVSIYMHEGVVACTQIRDSPKRCHRRALSRKGKRRGASRFVIGLPITNLATCLESGSMLAMKRRLKRCPSVEGLGRTERTGKCAGNTFHTTLRKIYTYTVYYATQA